MDNTHNMDIGRVQNEGMIYPISIKNFNTLTMRDLKNKSNHNFNNYVTTQMLYSFHLLTMFDADHDQYICKFPLTLLLTFVFQVLSQHLQRGNSYHKWKSSIVSLLVSHLHS